MPLARHVQFAARTQVQSRMLKERERALLELSTSGLSQVANEVKVKLSGNYVCESSLHKCTTHTRTHTPSALKVLLHSGGIPEVHRTAPLPLQPLTANRFRLRRFCLFYDKLALQIKSGIRTLLSREQWTRVPSFPLTHTHTQTHIHLHSLRSSRHTRATHL